MSIVSVGIDYIIVLVRAEDLMHRLEETEATVVALREDLARASAERTMGSTLRREGKKERYEEKRRVQCSEPEDVKSFINVCELFNILPTPKNTLSHRSECFYIGR